MKILLLNFGGITDKWFIEYVENMLAQICVPLGVPKKKNCLAKLR